MSQEDDMKDDGNELSRWEKQTQRTIDFILQQQAQSASDTQRHKEQFDSDIRRISGLLDRLASATLTRFNQAEGEIGSLDTKMEALVDSHIKLTDAQAQTDEKLSAFIDTVERLISERRNGGNGAGENLSGEGGQ